MANERPHFIDTDVKRLRMQKNLSRVQAQLNPTQQRFSRLIHQPLIQLVSEAISVSIGRASGLFAAGLTALLGSGIYIFIAAQYNLTYDYRIFFILCAIGYAIGLIAEYSLVVLHRLRR
jgi:hypothetical protein